MNDRYQENNTLVRIADIVITTKTTNNMGRLGARNKRSDEVSRRLWGKGSQFEEAQGIPVLDVQTNRANGVPKTDWTATSLASLRGQTIDVNR